MTATADPIRGMSGVLLNQLANPRLFLRVRGGNPAALRADLKALSATARRALGRVGEEALLDLAPRAFRRAQADCQALFARLEKEVTHA